MQKPAISKAMRRAYRRLRKGEVIREHDMFWYVGSNIHSDDAYWRSQLAALENSIGEAYRPGHHEPHWRLRS
jgi:hypothetical protein